MVYFSRLLTRWTLGHLAGTEGSQEDSQDAAREEPRPRPGATHQGKRGHEVDTEQKTGDTGTDMGGDSGMSPSYGATGISLRDNLSF